MAEAKTTPSTLPSGAKARRAEAHAPSDEERHAKLLKKQKRASVQQPPSRRPATSERPAG